MEIRILASWVAVRIELKVKTPAPDLTHQGTLGSHRTTISEPETRTDTPWTLTGDCKSKFIRPETLPGSASSQLLHTQPPPDRSSLSEPWARAPCLEHGVHTAIWRVDTKRRRSQESQQDEAKRAWLGRRWEQARGEVEWGHTSPEEAGTQEGGTEGCLSCKEDRKESIAGSS